MRVSYPSGFPWFGIIGHMLLFAPLILAFISLLPNLSVYPFKNEESLRTVVSFEMWHDKSYMQPTFLGELYFNKPPLFNWLTVVYSYLLPWSELTARVVTLTFLLLTMISVFFFSYHLFRRLELSLLASLIFITFGNVLFFYGYLAEIDITFTFFVFTGIVFLYLWYKTDKVTWTIPAGVMFGLSTLLKGFPAFAFLLLSLFAFALYKKSVDKLLGRGTLLLYAISMLLPLLWIAQTQDPMRYVYTLIRESSARVLGDFSRLGHMVLYPLVNFKDLLPWSLLFLVAAYISRKSIKFPTEIRLLTLLFFVNYVPYWISNSAGRYIIPLYPLLAIIFAFYIHSNMHNRAFQKVVIGIALATIVLRFFYGFFFFPYEANREGSRKTIALDMASFVDSKSTVACECPEEKSVCLYFGILRGKPLKRLNRDPQASYVITCRQTFGNPLKEYNIKGKRLSLERLYP